MLSYPKIEHFLSEIISIPSVTGNEKAVLDYVHDFMVSNGFEVRKIPINETRYNLYVQEGSPKVCFSSHLDVVPGNPKQFQPYIENGKLYGRGSCDAKGQIASQLYAALKLKEEKKSGYALLFVVGEEDDGVGAKNSSEAFSKHFFDYFVNGEPTELKLISAHKGAITFNLTVSGKAAHSGYPEYGVDANRKLFEICNDLSCVDLGTDPTLGTATLNIGKIEGGYAANIVSDFAVAHCIVRTVTRNNEVLDKIKRVVNNRAHIEVVGSGEVMNLTTVNGFETGIVSYFTDIPYYKEISKNYLLYGPGHILQAHATDEYILVEDLYQAVEGLLRLYNSLSS